MNAHDIGPRPRLHPTLAFLELLGKDPDNTYFRSIGKAGANRARNGADLRGFDAAALARDNTDAGIYAVIGNATGASGKRKDGTSSCCVTDVDVATVPGFVAEWDDRPIEWQLSAWRELGLPEPSLQVLTGGKSVHSYWMLAEPLPAAEWRVLQRRLLAHCNADPSICNPARLMRVPGFKYIDKKTGKPTGGIAELIQCSNTRYSAAEIEAYLPPVIEPAATAPSATPPRPHRRTGDLTPRTLQEIEAAAACIPRRVGGQGTYDRDRNALCGCSAALAEAGSPDPDGAALVLLGGLWPDHKAAEQVLRSTHTRKAASFWAIAGEHGYKLNRTRPQLQALDGGRLDQQCQRQEAAPRPDLELIREAADRVVNENINRSRKQYLHCLRELFEADLNVPPRDDLYRREIAEAILRRDGIESKPFIGGQELPDDDDEWLIAGLILAGAINIIGADPKAGKTLWAVALIASLLHGCQQFIGRDITRRPQTVIIVGPDQPVKLWKRQLKAVGLVQGNILDPRIVRLWDSHNPWVATPEGIAELRQTCSKHPCSLVLFDSLAKISEKLGLDENSREAAEVLSDIGLACTVHACTPLVVHHNAKAAGRIGIVNGAALRGNGAIRANASQVVILTLIEPDNPKDTRRRLVTEGRGTEFVDNVIRLEDGGKHWSHVCEFSEHRSAAKEEKAREKLTTKQLEALEALEASRRPLTTAQVWASAYRDQPWDTGKTDCRNLARTLNQLLDKRVVKRHPGPANRPTWSACTRLCVEGEELEELEKLSLTEAIIPPPAAKPVGYSHSSSSSAVCTWGVGAVSAGKSEELGQESSSLPETPSETVQTDTVRPPYDNSGAAIQTSLELV